MKRFVKPALVAGLAGILALGAVSSSQARVRPWVAGAAGFAAGAAVGAAAANSGAYYNNGYNGGYEGAGYYGDNAANAYTGDPAYAGYGAYGYAPGYSRYGYDASTQSYPAHRDPGYGYNSNTLSPWQDRKMQGSDY